MFVRWKRASLLLLQQSCVSLYCGGSPRRRQRKLRNSSDCSRCQEGKGCFASRHVLTNFHVISVLKCKRPCCRWALADPGSGCLKVEIAACAHATSCTCECLYPGEGVSTYIVSAISQSSYNNQAALYFCGALNQARKPKVVYRVDGRMEYLRLLVHGSQTCSCRVEHQH